MLYYFCWLNVAQSFASTPIQGRYLPSSSYDYLRLSNPLTVIESKSIAGSTVTLNGDLGTSLLANVTFNLWGPGSTGAKAVWYPSVVWLSNKLTFWPLGFVTVAMHGASGLPVLMVLIWIGLTSPTLIARNRGGQPLSKATLEFPIFRI